MSEEPQLVHLLAILSSSNSGPNQQVRHAQLSPANTNK